MGRQNLKTDIAIIGGGIAGLWALNQLRNAGYSAILFEQDTLGSCQTIASQGMIHGGIKYALGGALSGGSEAISVMPDIWRRCLKGGGKVDLRGSRVLSEEFYLWSSAGLQSRLTSFLASKMLRGRVAKVATDDYPAPFRNAQFRGKVYRLADLVIDVHSLVETLTNAHREAIFRIDWDTARLVHEGGLARLELPDLSLHPRRLLLAAGIGNEALISQLGGCKPAMQRRPLQQVLVKHQYREALYAHCMGGNPSPRLTISSHRTLLDEPVWSLGGDLATEGMNDPPQVLIAKAQTELRELFPWIDFGNCQWYTMKIDRGEPLQSSRLKPDQAYVGKVDEIDNVLVAWPTKLTLSPNLADNLEQNLVRDGIAPLHKPDLSLLAFMGQPDITPNHWDTVFT
ncbi:MAG: FAD-dependent oxidoreductase [Halieaceae bacterium]|jgi:hypothetical protein|nr:FAD-dependent oxidoreductase [Halieaceae bacterium]